MTELKILKKYFALFSIYLVISITFLTANALSWNNTNPDGSLIDTQPPIISLNAQKINSGLNIGFTITDHLNTSTDTTCSGIMDYTIYINNRAVNTTTLNISDCTYSGSFFVNMSNMPSTDSNIVYYSMDASDLAGNDNSTLNMNVTGDFKAPIIADSFKILKNGNEITAFSSSAQSDVGIVLDVDEINLKEVYADFSSLNRNPAINNDPYYRHMPATCGLLPGNKVYECTFSPVRMMPGSSLLNVSFTATDVDGNTAVKTVNKVITLKDSAGSISYIGPPKEQCTADLSTCYTKSGQRVFYVDLDATSSYNNSIVNLGIGDTTTFSICKLNNTIWRCTAVGSVPKDTESLNLYIASSTDDYGTVLTSNLERNVIIDDVAPENISALDASNNNNNVNCSVSGDELTLKLKVKEDKSQELKMYVNTSGFTTLPTQSTACSQDGTNWNCELVVKNFISSQYSVKRNIIIEDLAGNQKKIPYSFNVCQLSSTGTPNIISSVTQKSVPTIDRRTSSVLPVRTYIPLHLTTSGGILMYLSIDSCVATGNNGMSILGPDKYFTPSQGTDAILVLGIGAPNADIPEGNIDINCTLSARVRIGNTVFSQDEKEKFTITVNTFDQPLGSIDQTASDRIKEKKQEIKDLNDRIDAFKKIDNILGKICDIANVMAKINGVLQGVKAVIYAVCLVINLIPLGVTQAAAQELWSGINSVASTFDSFAQTYFWPTGISLTSTIGYIVKYSCMVYTCQFYTVQGLYTSYTDFNGISDAIAEEKAKSDAAAALPQQVQNSIDKMKKMMQDPGYKQALKEYNDNFNSEEAFDAYKKEMDPHSLLEDSALRNMYKDEYHPPTLQEYATQNMLNTINTAYPTTLSTLPTQGAQAGLGTVVEWNNEEVPDPNGNYVGDIYINDKGVIADRNGDDSVAKENFNVIEKNGKYYAQDTGTGKFYEITNYKEVSQTTDWKNQFSSAGAGQGTGVVPASQDSKSYDSVPGPTPDGRQLYLNKEDGKYYTKSADGTYTEYSPTPEGVTPKQIPSATTFTLRTNIASTDNYVVIPGISDTTNDPDTFTVKTLDGVVHTFTKAGSTPVGPNAAGSTTSLYVDSVNNNQYKLDRGNSALIITSGASGTPTASVKPVAITPVGGVTQSIATPSTSAGSTWLGNYHDIVTGYWNYYSNPDGSYYKIQLDKASGKEVGQRIPTSKPTYSSSDYFWTPSGKIIQDITGKATNLPSTNSPEYAARDMQFYSELSSNKWIVNPYKSEHYDDLCAPAILYNMEKRKQITCIYVSCLEKQLAEGMPTVSCDQQYSLYSCLYLDSAQWKFESGAEVWITGLLRSATTAAIGLGVQLAFQGACGTYINSMGEMTLSGSTQALEGVGAFEAVGCGVASVALQWKDIQTVFSKQGWKDLMGSERPGDPAAQHDYCADVKLDE